MKHLLSVIALISISFFSVNSQSETIDIKNKDYQESLLEAAQYGQFKKVKEYIELGGDIQIKDELDLTFLHLAVYNNHEGKTTNMIKYLMDKGADVNAKDSEGQTPIFFANTKSDMNRLVDAGADINILDNNGATILHIGARRDNLELMEFALDAGIDINAKDKGGYTPLYYAFFIEPPMRPSVGYLVFGGSVQGFVGYMVNKSALVNSLIIRDQNLEAAKYLISKDAYVNAQDNKGQSLLYHAIENGSINSIELLMQNGADPYLKNRGFLGLNSKSAMDIVTEKEKYIIKRELENRENRNKKELTKDIKKGHCAEAF